MPKKDDDGYYGVSAFITVSLVLTLHYFLLANLNIPSTLHVLIGLFMFFIIVGILNPILKRFWNQTK